MTIKDKLKSYNFWITLVSAIILLLQVFGEKFNFKIDSTFIIDVTTALCSIFVVLGLISVPKSKTTKTDIRIIEPNYDELCSKISNELSSKITFNETIENKTETKDDLVLSNNNLHFEESETSSQDNTEKKQLVSNSDFETDQNDDLKMTIDVDIVSTQNDANNNTF